MKNLEFSTNFNKQQSDEIENLNQLLSKIGIDISLKPSGKLIIQYDVDEIEKKLSRNAGRHEKYFDVVLTSEVRERMKNGESAEDIAKSLGISRSTFFRKLKKAEELHLLHLS